MSARSSLDDNRVQLRPFAYRVNDAGKMLGVGRTTIFEMIRTGTLEAKKIGAATVITHESLERVFQAAELTNATKRAETRA